MSEFSRKKSAYNPRRLKRFALRLLKNMYARAYVLINRSRIDFDPDFYLKQYPDVSASGVDPYRHYVFHGRAEGRVGQSPKLEASSEISSLDSSKETVLVVSHEASRTGAPVLSLNLVMRLKQKYNVIVMVLGPGELEDEFIGSGAVYVAAKGLRASADHARLLIDKICNLVPLKFAIINSVESRVVLPGLAFNFIPSITLLHEFPAYIRPKTAFLEVMFWSTETVFSSRVIHESTVRELPGLADCPVHILPQGQCEVSFAAVEDNDRSEEAEKLNETLSRLKKGGKHLILGAGMVQLRKGVDLFIDCALRVLESGKMRNMHFVWIGKGYDPERDIQYSAYLYDQLLRAGLDQHVTFLPETTAIDIAYQNASAVLITSRLDPLPNVAIDAITYGVPVFCFARATGLVEFLDRCNLHSLCVAKYLHVSELADKLIALLDDAGKTAEVGALLKENAKTVFSMDNYLAGLSAIAESASVHAAQEKTDLAIIANSAVYRVDFVARHLLCDDEFTALRTYVRAWASGVEKRKLFPGFHPGIFAADYKDYRPKQDPLASYLSNGKPQGRWVREVITSTTKTRSNPDTVKCALHVHVFYSDLFDELMSSLSLNKIRPTLFLSVPNEQIKLEIQARCNLYLGEVAAIEVVPNRGRDIGPFLSSFEGKHLQDYEFVGHLHTKKTKDREGHVGRVWYRFLLANLLGKQTGMADVILTRMVDEPKLGMVFADDPNLVGWDANLAYATDLADKLGLTSLPTDITFPVGTMFWARTECFTPFLRLGLTWEDYPEEPLAYDGSVLHALERLFPLVVEAGGHEIALTNVPTITR